MTTIEIDEINEAVDEANKELNEFDEEFEEWPADMNKRFPLPASLTEPLSETARKVNADIEAGRIIDGETLLAEMRERAGRRRAALPDAEKTGAAIK